MAIAVKALLLKHGNKYGCGLNAIRHMESELIDITEFEAGLSDATMTTNPHCIVKDNVCYRTIKTYFDLDLNARIVVCQEATENASDTYDGVKTVDVSKTPEAVTEVLNAAEDGAKVELTAGNISAAMTMEKGVNLVGATADEPKENDRHVKLEG